MALLSRSKVTTVASLFEYVLEAFVTRVTEPLVAGHFAHLSEMVLKGQETLWLRQCERPRGHSWQGDHSSVTRSC